MTTTFLRTSPESRCTVCTATPRMITNGFLEEHEGKWPERGNEVNEHDLEIGIGRLPVRTGGRSPSRG